MYMDAPHQVDEANQAARALDAVADLYEMSVIAFPMEFFALGLEIAVDGGDNVIVLSLQHLPLGGAYAEKATLTTTLAIAVGEVWYNDQFAAFTANIGDKVKVRVTDAGSATTTGRVFVGYRRSPKAKPTHALFKEVAA